MIALIKQYQPDAVLNLALPYQDLTIMDACLACKVPYIDTANYEAENTDDPAWRAIYEKRCEELGFSAYFDYSWQWAYMDRFKEAGITGLLGTGFDRHWRNFYPVAVFPVRAGSGYLAEVDFRIEVGCKRISMIAAVAVQNINRVNFIEKRCEELGFSAYFDYSWQWAYMDRFKEAGITGLLGTGFDRHWRNFYPVAVFPVRAGSGYLAEVDFRIEVGCKRISMIAAVAVQNINRVNFIEIVFLCIGCKNAGDTRVKAYV